VVRSLLAYFPSIISLPGHATFARRRDDVFITGEELVHGVDIAANDQREIPSYRLPPVTQASRAARRN